MGDDRAWLEGLVRFGIHPGLERMRVLLDAIGHPEQRFDTILVAGTNGKGSTTALLHAMLVAAGRRAGRFVSPHLERFEERVVVGDAPVAPDRVDAALARLREVADGAGATYFEVVTAMALAAFAEAGAEIAVLEVGMGGRLDATNVVEPIVSVVTSVDLDHVDVLGPRLEDIAREKAGVARPRRPLLTAATGVAGEVVQDVARARGASVWNVHAARPRVRDLGWAGVGVDLDVPDGRRWSLRTPLLGRHQGMNLALAAAAASVLGVPEVAARAGAAAVSWPGRLEPIERAGRRWLLDGAHNPAGARALAEALASLAPKGIGALVVGVSADKDVAGIVDALWPLTDQVVCTAAGHSPRALAPATLADRWSAAGGGGGVDVTVADDLAEALQLADMRAPQGEVVVVAGSLFLVGEARALLHGRTRPGPRWQ